MTFDKYILVYTGTNCPNDKKDEIYNTFIRECEKHSGKVNVQTVKADCMGFHNTCAAVKILPDDTFYVNVAMDDVKEIVEQDIVGGKKVSRLVYDTSQSRKQVKIEEADFYQKQVRIVLRNCGIIDPDNINEYIARERLCSSGKSPV